MTGTELSTREEAERQLIEAQNQEFEASNVSFRAPLLKVGQPLTAQVKAGDAAAGEFVDTSQDVGIGTEVEFIIAYYNVGRFASDRKTNRGYSTTSAIIPDSWAPLLGEQFVGTPFAEHPDAEERYKERVNNKEIEWGHGPLISTTHNYTGLVLVDDQYQAARLSLKRTDMPAVRKIAQARGSFLRNKPLYNVVWNLSTYEKSFSSGSSWLINPKPGRQTTAEERELAFKLAVDAHAGNVSTNEDAADAAPAPVPTPASALPVG